LNAIRARLVKGAAALAIEPYFLIGKTMKRDIGFGDIKNTFT
jgi:hypothetical protein